MKFFKGNIHLSTKNNLKTHTSRNNNGILPMIMTKFNAATALTSGVPTSFFLFELYEITRTKQWKQHHLPRKHKFCQHLVHIGLLSRRCGCRWRLLRLRFTRPSPHQWSVDNESIRGKSQTALRGKSGAIIVTLTNLSQFCRPGKPWYERVA